MGRWRAEGNESRLFSRWAAICYRDATTRERPSARPAKTLDTASLPPYSLFPLARAN